MRQRYFVYSGNLIERFYTVGVDFHVIKAKVLNFVASNQSYYSLYRLSHLAAIHTDSGLI